MAQFEKFLSSNKPVFAVLYLAALPFALIWSIIYGIIIGIAGTTVERLEAVRRVNQSDRIESLKYPKWKSRKYQQLRLDRIEDKNQRAEAEMQYASGKLSTPTLFGYYLQNIILYGIIFYPAFLLYGIIVGPFRAFFAWQNKCGKIWNS